MDQENGLIIYYKRYQDLASHEFINEGLVKIRNFKLSVLVVWRCHEYNWLYPLFEILNNLMFCWVRGFKGGYEL